MMNTTAIKEVSKWMMVAGAGIFTCGLGVNFACRSIERKEARLLQEADIREIEKEELTRKREVEISALSAQTEKDRLYSEQLKAMDSKAFAKFHAEQIAKANEDVIANANAIKAQVESEMLKVRMSCSDEIDKIRKECLAKVEAANKARDEAVTKYEQIDALFTNKKEILKAKEALEAAVRKDQVAKENKEELLKSIKDILE